MAGEVIRYEEWLDFPAKGRRHMQIAYAPYLATTGEVLGFVVNKRDITDERLAKDALRQHQENLEQIIEERTAALRSSEQRLADETAATATIVNQLLAHEPGVPETEREVIRACLAATSSQLGMIGAVDAHGEIEATALSRLVDEEDFSPLLLDSELSPGADIRAVCEWSLTHAKPLLCNDMKKRSCRAINRPGRASIDSALTVPIRDGDTVAGVVAVADRRGGYSRADQETLTRLAATIAVGRRYRQALTNARLTSEELDRLVRQRTAELEATNRELESFAYSVSHDLRAPLRAIDGFSRAFVEDYGDRVGSAGRDQLNRVRAGAQRMGRLIDDLLRLSRLGRVETSSVEVDLTAMAHDIIEEFRASEPQREVIVEIATDLRATGDPTLLKSALQNLLSNAWKFTAFRRPGKIQFYTDEIEGRATFVVRDNGAGFDMAYADKLFGVFQRLHNADEFPGTGVGLATVSRVVARHGGRVWAKSKEGEGATFYFTMPDSSLRAEGQT
jgi:signal transduction histidine kinase